MQNDVKPDTLDLGAKLTVERNKTGTAAVERRGKGR